MNTVNDIMNANVRTVGPNATIDEAAKKMKKFRIGSIVVVKGKKPVGIITERDMTYKIVAEGKVGAKVEEVMSKDLKTVDKDTTLVEAVKLMSAHVIRRLPVTEKGKIVGIITSNDIMKAEKLEEAAGDYSGDPDDYSFS
jgi:CBS domain-containing protein